MAGLVAVIVVWALMLVIAIAAWRGRGASMISVVPAETWRFAFGVGALFVGIAFSGLALVFIHGVTGTILFVCVLGIAGRAAVTAIAAGRFRSSRTSNKQAD